MTKDTIMVTNNVFMSIRLFGNRGFDLKAFLSTF